MSTSRPHRPNGGPASGAAGGSGAAYWLEQLFDRDSLVALRAAVAAHGDQLGLPSNRVEDLVLVAHELATNSVRHGGGQGRLRLWTGDGMLFCEVADEGGGFAYHRPEDRRPPLGATGGRGLWIVAKLVDALQVVTPGNGTVVTVQFRLD